MSIRVAVTVIALGLFLAPAAAAQTSGATGAAGVPTLSVEGQGQAFVTPDVAQVEIDVTQQRPTSRAALSTANRRTDAIVRAVKGLGVPASGIQTEGVNVSTSVRRRGHKGHRHKVKAYVADESLSVTTTSALVAAVIDAATAHGATSISGPNFSFSNPSAGMTAATSAALTDARTRAQAAAAQMGYTVTGVQSINLNPGSGTVNGPQTTTAASGAPAPKAATPTTVHPGAQEVDAEVEVTFTIAPA